MSEEKKKHRLVRGNLHGETIYYDIDTENKSFLEVSQTLKKRGIRNHMLMLMVKNPKVVSIDPWSDDLTLGEQAIVLDEVMNNYWYFIREVFHVATSGDPIPYGLNRANFVISFLMTHNINTIAIMPRQHGKTVTSITLFNYFMLFNSRNTTAVFTHKAYNDAVMNLTRLKDSFEQSLPSYLTSILNPSKDRNKETQFKIDANKNEIRIVSPSASKADADKAGRGMTAPLIYIDEIAFIKNIKTMYGALAPAFSKASETAKKNNTNFGILVTTTPGSLTDRDAIDAKNMVDSAATWSEMVLDKWEEQPDKESADKYLREWVADNSMNDFVHVQYSYKQLGRDDMWLKGQIRTLQNDMELVKRELLLEWTQSSNNSPFSEELLDSLNSNVIDKDDYQGRITLMNDRFTVNVIEQPRNLLNKNYIIGVDVSAGLQRDYSAISVIDPKNMKPVMYFKNNTISVPELKDLLIELISEYIPNGILVIERNNAGITLIQLLEDSKISSNLYYKVIGSKGNDTIVSVPNRLTGNAKYFEPNTGNKRIQRGVNTTTGVRDTMINEILFMIINEHPEIVNNSDLMDDIKNLERKKTGKIEHADGQHDDLLFSMLIGLYPFLYDTGFNKFLKNVSDNPGGKDNLSDADQAIMDDKKKKYRKFKNFTRSLENM